MLRLLVTANVFPSLPIPVTLMMELIRSSEMFVLTRAIWHNTPEDGILSHITCIPLIHFIFKDYVGND
jgi:hypothetical protein